MLLQERRQAIRCLLSRMNTSRVDALRVFVARGLKTLQSAASSLRTTAWDQLGDVPRVARIADGGVASPGRALLARPDQRHAWRQDEDVEIVDGGLHRRERLLQPVGADQSRRDERGPGLLDAPLQELAIVPARERRLVNFLIGGGEAGAPDQVVEIARQGGRYYAAAGSRDDRVQWLLCRRFAAAGRESADERTTTAMNPSKAVSGAVVIESEEEEHEEEMDELRAAS
jgi:hypothetical protein